MPRVVLTGATRGIGEAAALALARQGAEVAVVGRDAGRVAATVEALRAAGDDGAAGHVADLARMEETRRLAAELLAAYPRIDVLAHNAGAMFSSRHLSDDGFEQTLALNHLSPFLLTALLRERLLASGGARVVTTASDQHRRAQLDLDDLQSANGRFRPGRAYANSKLCNVLFTRELQRRQPGLAANCFHPGTIRSGFGRNDGTLTRLSMTVAAPFMGSPEKGAEALVWLALDPAAGELRGEYLEKGKPTAPSEAAQDDALAAALWQRSEQLTGLAG